MASTQTVLITGGAGFIGSHLARELLEHGYRVRVLDNLTPQVHGADAGRPDYLEDDVELRIGDVRDERAVRAAVAGVDAVFHYAAAVGVGQSMYQVSHYTTVNNGGTGVLLEALAEHPVGKLVVASSMSLYGEGLYRNAAGEFVTARRRRQQLVERDGVERDWELRDDAGQLLAPVPTPETKTPDLSSVYALSKFDQERLCLMVAEANGIPATALRFFNVYGPHQALSNPYTGVLAIFASRFLNGRPPLIFEDGAQCRDFVSVHDIAQASRLALENPAADGGVFNIGSGRAYTINGIADELRWVLGGTGPDPEITGRYRVGDVRHCFADIDRARRTLGYTPRVTLAEGLAEMADWLADAHVHGLAEDRVDQASAELLQRGLTV